MKRLPASDLADAWDGAGTSETSIGSQSVAVRDTTIDPAAG
jgi:hypothetical protein